MTMNPMDDFLYHLKRYMEYTTEMRSSYEHLSEHEKKMILEAHPDGNSPEVISKQVYQWHDTLFKRMEKEK
ncbi:hypothetical protein GCM10010954_08840 [Halobacillus andaensis]|uniref:Uncharacterized protein n=1 Tax=Halobacillus andaensis TaxID=1176239 RepID=A0A917B0T1_HALAA|nr:hypothetical protein [Halobacillus andaensis]MBP2003672.1 hypothetical protein [Halobacillus andaensis]GGF12370.1 hypothetical protein GCM10010954_08840 [Halobacillus andaensis]